MGVFSQWRHPANVAAVHRVGVFGRYRRLTAAVEKLMKDDGLTGFALSHVPPPETDAIEFGWLSVSAGEFGFKLSGKIGIVSLEALAAEVVPAITKLYPAKYGYGYILDAALGPEFHAVGMLYRRVSDAGIAASLPEQEQNRAGRWSNQREKALADGILRDVLPVNYLTEVHAETRINGQRLFDWIRQDSSRGVLRQVRSGAWLWRVAEAHCLGLGQKFESAGLLI